MSVYYNPGHILREWFHCILLYLLEEWWSHMWWRVYCITYIHDAIFMSAMIILISLVAKSGGGTRWNLQYALFFCSAWKTTYARGPIQPASALQYTDFPQKCSSNASRSDITASLRPPYQLEAQVCTTCAVINISDNIPVLFSKLVCHP